MYNHIIDRNLVKWRSVGRYGKGPYKETLIKDLSDSHLLHIIGYVKNNRRLYGQFQPDIIQLMEQEMLFRTRNYIFVPDYPEDRV